MRARCVTLFGLAFLICISPSAWAKERTSSRSNIDIAARTTRACKAIAALADHGSRALNAASLVGRDQPVDLRNDGHLEKIVRAEQGTMHVPFLTNEAGNEVSYGNRNDYPESLGRLASEISVIRINGRTWEVGWDAVGLDGTASLQGATDGTDVCRFHVAFQPPVFRMLSRGNPAKINVYRSLLLGHGLTPPSAGLDIKAVDAASNLNVPYVGGATYTVEAPSWRADLLNNKQPLDLVRVNFSSSAGAGCERNMLGLVQNGRVTKLDLLPLYGTGWGSDGDMVPLSRSFRKLVQSLSCVNLTITPVLGQDGRTYVLLANNAQVRLLVGAINGTMQPLARLFWKARNQTELP